MNADIVGAHQELIDEVGAVLRENGVTGRRLTCGAIVGYEYALPTQRGILRARAFVSPPTEVGGRLGRRIRRKLKKIVKNKALKALGKVAKMAASFVPGGGAVVQAAEMGVNAARAIKNARVSGNQEIVGALPASLRLEARRLRRLRRRGNWA